jgi:uncharacterized membrane protein YfcA
METIPLWLPVLFFVIAVAYASAGFGGGSAYIAAMVLIGLSYQIVPQTALVCNLIVSAGGVWHFSRAGHFDWRRLLPFIILSVPMAYLGGRVQLGHDAFMLLLGCSLLAAGIRLLLPAPRERDTPMSIRTAWLAGLPVGAALGFLAGVVGIGGGVFLAPLLLITGWAKPKQAAAAAAVFILMNSAAGLAGQVAKGWYLGVMVAPLAIAALVGGQIGSRLGARRMTPLGVRRVLASLVLVVSIRVLWGML